MSAPPLHLEEIASLEGRFLEVRGCGNSVDRDRQFGLRETWKVYRQEVQIVEVVGNGMDGT